jgi:hypothetical protein
MPILATAKGTYTPAPEGVHQAVCVDVIDLGIVYSEKFNSSAHKIDIVFQINAVNPENNKRFLIRSRNTLSLSPKANLRVFLEAWRGKKFTSEDLEKGFDVEKLVGANANINVVHNGDWANIASIMPLTQGQPKIDNLGYVREVKTQVQPAPQSAMSAATGTAPAQATSQIPVDDDEVPF